MYVEIRRYNRSSICIEKSKEYIFLINKIGWFKIEVKRSALVNWD